MKAIGKGKGLGMAIARQIIIEEKHDGTITCDSNLGQAALSRLHCQCWIQSLLGRSPNLHPSNKEASKGEYSSSAELLLVGLAPTVMSQPQ